MFRRFKYPGLPKILPLSYIPPASNAHSRTTQVAKSEIEPMSQNLR